MRQAIKSFDSLVNPLRFAIRNLIKEILKETIQAESDDSLINNFYYVIYLLIYRNILPDLRINTLDSPYNA